MAQLEKVYQPEALADEQYISLTTYRKNGNAISTPVWFVQIEGKVYVKTSSDAWKVVRIRNNKHVKFTACDARGTEHGETFNGMAQLHDEGTSTAQKISQAMNDKYGLFVRLFDLFYKIRQRDYTYIEITPQ